MMYSNITPSVTLYIETLQKWIISVINNKKFIVSKKITLNQSQWSVLNLNSKCLNLN